MTNHTTLEALAKLLGEVDAIPVIRPTRFAPSTLYDIDYRLAVVACAFDVHSESNPRGKGRRIRTAALKLLQFVAARPWLLPAVQEWVAVYKDSQRKLLAPHSLRRGFVGDQTHDRIILYLTAQDAFRRDKGFLVESARSAVLLDLVVAIKEANLFEEERRVLGELSGTRLTVKMLEGR